MASWKKLLGFKYKKEKCCFLYFHRCKLIIANWLLTKKMRYTQTLC